VLSLTKSIIPARIILHKSNIRRAQKQVLIFSFGQSLQIFIDTAKDFLRIK
jgi:hypothetical protein